MICDTKKPLWSEGLKESDQSSHEFRYNAHPLYFQQGRGARVLLQRMPSIVFLLFTLDYEERSGLRADH